ncbi:hypothetical protein LOOC260_114410 [Paucilactobacillus hokkaidonensis JCM 18461]|uniref:Uncharacterized protein n=1 Tax=Paucilactobacillus hokkaidonensis JCM 18461 TaxID=1291742 RepID=A0A0A1GUK5_9LACO|nr:hypothetical protein [Paucilactobacillus hokkaidonensis]BAP85977.1 hypothetical protein LOOC260_114410 [Paucilactobacillus hokkaidonensis JCM 18461]
MDHEVNSYLVIETNGHKLNFLDKQKATDYADKYKGTVEVVKLRIGG